MFKKSWQTLFSTSFACSRHLESFTNMFAATTLTTHKTYKKRLDFKIHIDPPAPMDRIKIKEILTDNVQTDN